MWCLTGPLSTTDTLAHKDIISMKKLIAEGKLDECKVVLGWETDTRSLLVPFLQGKHSNVNQILTNYSHLNEPINNN